jgi:hypothetical protein
MGEIVDLENYRSLRRPVTPKASPRKSRLVLTPAGKKRLREILRAPPKPPKPPPVLTPIAEKQLRAMADRMLRKGMIERGADGKLRYVSTGHLAFPCFAML